MAGAFSLFLGLLGLGAAGAVNAGQNAKIKKADYQYGEEHGLHVKKENQQIRATAGGESLCMTCGRVSPLSTQSTFEDLAVDFEGTTASGAERFYRRTLDKLRLKLLESRLVHTVTLKQTECRKRNKK